MKLMAANDRLVIELLDRTEKTTESGLILSEEATGVHYEKAKVISVGEKVDTDIRKDDVVVIKKGTYFPFKFEDNDWKILDAPNVLVVLRD